MADRFTELMEDLGMHVARSLNPPPMGVYGGIVDPATTPTIPPPRLRDQPETASGSPLPQVGTTPMPDVMQPQGWQPQGVPPPNTQSPNAPQARVAAGNAPPPPMVQQGPFPPPGAPSEPAPPLPQPTQQLAGGVADLVQSLFGPGAPDVSREGSVNPMAPPSGAVPPLPVGQPDADLARFLGIELRPQMPSISTAQISGYEPQQQPSAPTTERKWTSAGTGRGIYGADAGTGAPSAGGVRPTGGPTTPSSTAGAGPGASTPGQTTAPAPSAGTPAGERTPDRFGVSPRTYQLLGVIGATLAMGSRPGESPAATLGRAVGAGMMYDNFARLSDVEQQANERALAIREKQVGIQGAAQADTSRMTTARIDAIKADIENDKKKLALATSREEREAIIDGIKAKSAAIGLRYAGPLAEAELDVRRAQAGKPGDTQRAQFLSLVEKSKNADGTTDWATVSRAAKLTGLGRTQSPAVISEGRRRLEAIKDPAQRARMREWMNSYLVDEGFLPEL